MLVQDVVAIVLGFIGEPEQPHPAALQRLPPLAVVAGSAGADQVLPTVLAPFVARDHVVYGQLSGLRPAVLAGVVIAVEDLPPGQLSPGPWSLDQVDEPDHRGLREYPRWSLDPTPVSYTHLTL